MGRDISRRTFAKIAGAAALSRAAGRHRRALGALNAAERRRDAMEALRIATIYGAESIGYGADLGSLEAGKLADLVVLDRNPLDDIKNSLEIRYVMKNGELYEGATLDRVWSSAEVSQAALGEGEGRAGDVTEVT